FPSGIPRVGPVREDIVDVGVGIRRFFDSPVHLQDEVPELLLAEEALFAFGFALSIVVDNAVDDLPVPVVSLRYFPISKIAAVEYRRKAGRSRIVRTRFRLRIGAAVAGGQRDDERYTKQHH